MTKHGEDAIKTPEKKKKNLDVWRNMKVFMVLPACLILSRSAWFEEETPAAELTHTHTLGFAWWMVSRELYAYFISNFNVRQLKEAHKRKNQMSSFLRALMFFNWVIYVTLWLITIFCWLRWYGPPCRRTDCMHWVVAATHTHTHARTHAHARRLRCGEVTRSRLYVQFSGESWSEKYLFHNTHKSRRLARWSRMLPDGPSCRYAGLGARLKAAHYPGPSQLSSTESPGATSPAVREIQMFPVKSRRKKLQNFNLQ